MPDQPLPSGKFTKADIIDALYEKTGMNRTDIRRVVDLVFNKMKEALEQRQIIELRGFGTFEVKIRKARKQARNPKTGENIVVNPHGVVTFRSGRELKQAVWEIRNEKWENIS
ncbi:MAG: integration host factor subunit beta [Treponema sp.]|jgi:integration host factor subunit beta|nr:integration host factor subunit beta [Treponema sp.]